MNSRPGSILSFATLNVRLAPSSAESGRRRAERLHACSAYGPAYMIENYTTTV